MFAWSGVSIQLPRQSIQVDTFPVQGTTVAALQTAINQAEAAGGGLVTFCGTLTDTTGWDGVVKILMDAPGVKIEGCNTNNATILFQADSSVGDTATTFISIAAGASQIAFSNLEIQADDTATDTNATLAAWELIDIAGETDGTSRDFDFYNVRLIKNRVDVTNADAGQLLTVGTLNAGPAAASLVAYGVRVHNAYWDIDGGTIGRSGIAVAVSRDPRLRYFVGLRTIDEVDSILGTVGMKYRINRKYTVSIFEQYDASPPASSLQ